jgi:hypothetical protein
MTPRKPPPRLLSGDAGTPDLLLEALREGRAELPSPEQLGRLEARLAQALNAPLPPSPPSPGAAGPLPAAAPGWMLSALKIGLGVLLAAGIAAGLLSRRPAPSASSLEGAQPAPVQIHSNAPSPLAASAPDQRRESTPKDAIRVEDLPDSTEDDARSRPRSSGSDAAGGETEAHLLQLAQESLGAAPAQALARTEEHARRFRGGALRQEREVSAITALQRLGRLGEARTRASRFLSQFPTSAHRSRLEALVGEGSAAAAPDAGAPPE